MCGDKVGRLLVHTRLTTGCASSSRSQAFRSSALIQCLTAWHACRGTPDPRDESLAAHLMRVRGPDGRLLAHARQWSELSIFFYAGMETTAHTIAW